MSARGSRPDDPYAWLSRARSNLIRSRQRVQGVYLEDLCFDAQQAAEKAVKAVLIHASTAFPRTHDLVRLLGLAEHAGYTLPHEVRQAGTLNDYAVASRYPGLAEPVSEEEYQEAVMLADRVLRWAEGILGEANSTAP
jgi:HEPN domain-containing protein